MDKKQREAGGSLSTKLAWSSLGLTFSQLTRIIFSLVIARALGPVAYALVVVTGIYLAVCTLLLDLGLTNAAIQIPRFTRAHHAMVQMISTVTGITVAVVTAAAALLFVHQPADLAVALAVSIFPLIRSCGLPSQYLLMRERRFKTLAHTEIVAAAVGLTVGFSSLVMVGGLFAFVAQVLAAELAQTLTLVWLQRPVRPSWHRNEALEFWKLGRLNFGTNVCSMLTRNLDNVIVGVVAGPAALSLYSVAYRFLTTPLTLMGQVVARVAVPEFATRLRSGAPVGGTFLRGTAALSLFGWPVMLIASFVVGPAFRQILGPDWGGAASIFVALAPAGILQISLYLAPAFWLASSRVGFHFRYSVVMLAVASFGFLVGAYTAGAVGVAASYSLTACLMSPFMISATARFLDLRLAVVSRSALLGAGPGAAAALIMFLVLNQYGDDLETLAVACVGATLVAAALSLGAWRIHELLVHRLRATVSHPDRDVVLDA